MPVYTLQGSDGKTYDVEGPPGATADELGEFIMSQSPAKPSKGFVGSAAEAAGNLGTGLATGAGQLGSAILAPYDIAADVAQSRPLGTGNRERRQAIAQFGKETAPDTESWNYMIGNATPEMVATGGPLAAVPTVAKAAAARVLPQAIAKFAPATADIGVNSAYSAAQAAAEGKDVGQAALWGAGGAAVGRALTRTLGGPAKPFVSQEARTLIERGVTPTPGQLFGDGLGGSMVRGVEDKLTSIPIAGDIINYARGRSIHDYGRAEVTQALDPIGAKASGKGADMIQRAQKTVSDVYDDVLPRLTIQQQTATDALDAGRRAAASGGYLDPRQSAELDHFLAMRVRDRVKQGPITGRVAKDIDTEMGFQARKYSQSLDPKDHALGEAFYDLQAHWREGMVKNATGNDAQALAAANASYRQLLPIVKASDRAYAQNGRFTPNQLIQAGKSANVGSSDLTRAGSQVLPQRVPDSGSAGRLLMGNLLGHATGFGTAAMAATAVSALVYSRPTVNFLVNGMGGLLPDATKKYIAYLAPKEAVDYMAYLAQRYPQLTDKFQSLVSQMGRELSTRSQQQSEGASQ
ncbi:MAG: hypothetical protein EON54_03830 [Alcaligenaceae bacterium]|nr:MAG: hypothetical protein EON54_03830 [Alcaligenaceae bacterium]